MSLILFAIVWSMALVEDRYTREAVVFSESLELDETIYMDCRGGLWATEWNHNVAVGQNVTLVMSSNGTHSNPYDDIIVKVKVR